MRQDIPANPSAWPSGGANAIPTDAPTRIGPGQEPTQSHRTRWRLPALLGRAGEEFPRVRQQMLEAFWILPNE